MERFVLHHLVLFPWAKPLNSRATTYGPHSGLWELGLYVPQEVLKGPWPYQVLLLEVVLLKMGMAHRVVSLIMQCIMMVSFSILINGEAHNSIISRRGL